MAKKSEPAKKPARAPAAKPKAAKPAGKAAKPGPRTTSKTKTTAKAPKAHKTEKKADGKTSKAAARKPAAPTARKAAATTARKPPQKTAGAAGKTAQTKTRMVNGVSAGPPEVLSSDEAPLDPNESAALLEHLRRIVRSLPETTEVEAWGHPTFRVNDKIFAGFGAEGGKASLGVKTTPDMQAALVSSDPRFKIAAYVGKHGWVELSLTGTVDLGEVEALVRGSYRLIAPARLVRKLDEAEG